MSSAGQPETCQNLPQEITIQANAAGLSLKPVVEPVVVEVQLIIIQTF